MIRSLVTGGAGFIGSHVARNCIELGQEVVVLDDLSGGFLDQVPEQATFINGSVTDDTLLNRIFDQFQFDYVYHLAAYAAEGLSHFIRRFNYTNNLIGSVNLINKAINYEVKCFVFTSSIAVYGSGQLPMDELQTPQPEDPYGISKLAIEQDLRAAHEMFGLDYIVFRPHNVYGEHQNIGDRYRNVIGIFMNQIMQGQPLTVFGDGTQTRAFSYIDDVAPYISRAPDIYRARNQVFNIGADTPFSINRLIDIMAETFEITPQVIYLPARNEVIHAYSSHLRAREILGAESRFSLKDGVARMAAWARCVGSRQGKPFENIEVRKNLPSIWTSI